MLTQNIQGIYFSFLEKNHWLIRCNLVKFRYVSAYICFSAVTQNTFNFTDKNGDTLTPTNNTITINEGDYVNFEVQLIFEYS